MMAGVKILVALLPWLLSACAWTVAPVLPAVAPGPFTPEGQVLFTVPDDYIEATLQPQVLSHRDQELAQLAEQDAERAQQVRRHEIVTGMTTQQVVWAFLSHPTRSEDHGPPGSHILLWDTVAWAGGRYWVRTDQWGQVAAAGRF